MLFTGSWLLLGLSHDGYSQVRGSISVLAGYGAPYAWVLTVAFLVQAAAMASAGWLLRRTAGSAAGLLAVNAVATIVVATARIGCNGGDADWCTPSAHPLSEGVHTVAATTALATLSLAPLAFGLRRDRKHSPVALACFAVMAPLLVAFGVLAGTGWAEKAVVTIGIFWAALTASRYAGA
ncbi:MAG: DUF998 domain-containing protein [Geodermatophilaceae bacterium]